MSEASSRLGGRAGRAGRAGLAALADALLPLAHLEGAQQPRTGCKISLGEGRLQRGTPPKVSGQRCI